MFSLITLAGVRTVILAHALAASASLIPVQQPSGVAVIVTDTAGVRLPNVRVTVTPLGRTATTNQEGRSAFGRLSPGRYHFTAILIGFAPGHADVTVLAADSAVEVAIRMQRSVLTLSAVQITATPTAVDPRRVAQSTAELSGASLQRSIGSTIAQSLSAEPGISMRSDGPAAAMPVIRGLTGERVLVLQDGNRTGDLASSSPDHAVSIDPLAAQKIEVVRGPASLLYGNNALGGVVNVISNDIPTAIPSHVEGYAAAQAESVTPGIGISAGATTALGRHAALSVRGGGRDLSDMRFGGPGVLRNSFNRTLFGTGSAAVVTERWQGGAAYRVFDFRYGLPSSDGVGATIVGARHEATARTHVSIESGLLTSIRANTAAQWYNHDEVEPTGEIGTTFELQTQTGDVLVGTRWNRLTGAVGVSGLAKQYAATGEEALTPGANTRGVGAFVYQELSLTRSEDDDANTARLELGARYDQLSVESQVGDPKFGPARKLSFGNVSGSVGVSLPLGEAVTAALSVARAFRSPSVEELFSNAVHEAVGTYDKGNASLEPETNQGFDLSLRVRTDRVTGQLGGYYNRVRNFISPRIVGDTTDSSGEVLPLNQFSQGNATLRGIEGQMETALGGGVVIGLLGDIVRGRLNDGSPIPFMPAAKLGALGRWENQRFQSGVDVRHVFAQRRIPTAVIPDDPAATSTDQYTLLNAFVGTTIFAGGWMHTFTLRMDNLMDARFREATSRIKHFAFGAGRNVSLVYRVLF